MTIQLGPIESHCTGHSKDQASIPSARWLEGAQSDDEKSSIQTRIVRMPTDGAPVGPWIYLPAAEGGGMNDAAHLGLNMAFSVVNRGSGLAQIAIEGQLDHATISVLRPELSRLLRLRPTRVDLDLSRLRLIDTSGVGMLLGFLKNLSDQGGQLSLCGLRDQPLEIFKLILTDLISAESDSPN